MKRLPLFISLLTATALAVGVSEAQRGPSGLMGPSMAGGTGFGILQYDANADGKVTTAEFDAAQRKAFAEIDGDKDGSATPEEIRTGRAAQARARHESVLKASFAEMDANKNGQVTEAEFLAAHKDSDSDRGLRIRARGPGPDRPGPMFVPGGPGGPGFGRGERGRIAGGPDIPGLPPGAPQAGTQGAPPQPGAAPAQRQMRAGPADADNDGKLTFAEFTARPVEAFTRADTNKDGTVTIAELQARAGIPR